MIQNIEIQHNHKWVEIKMQKQNKKIGLIIFWYSIGISPSLINLVVLLVKSGYEIHIFIDEESFNFSKINFHNKKVIFHLIKGIPNWQIKASSAYKSVFHQAKVFRSFFKYYRKVYSSVEKDFHFLIGADVFGIILANWIGQKKKIKTIYYNLELLLSWECKTLKDKIIKLFERRASQHAEFTIIQDKVRAKYLICDNGLARENILYLPVTVLQSHYRKSDFLRQKYKIPKNKKIILYAGEIEPGVLALEIVQAAQHWNDNLVLVMHASRSHPAAKKYINEICATNKSKQVYFSTDPVEWHQVPELLASADIGLAFYRNLSKNYYEIGMSSGKLASYLHAGLPVITSDFPSLRKIIDEYKIGKYTHKAEEIEKLARQILKNYDFYKKNVANCFKEKYNFKNYASVILKKIKEVESKNV